MRGRKGELEGEGGRGDIYLYVYIPTVAGKNARSGRIERDVR